MYSAQCVTLHLPQSGTEHERSGSGRHTLLDDADICFIRVCDLRTYFSLVPDVDEGD